MKIKKSRCLFPGRFLVAVQMAEEGKDDIPLDDLKGLWHRAPLPAIVFTIALVSLAGLPPTAGSTGKLLLLNRGLESGLVLDRGYCGTQLSARPLCVAQYYPNQSGR